MSEVLLTLMVTAIGCAILGPVLILRKLAMTADALSHSVLLGIVVAFFFVPDLRSIWPVSYTHLDVYKRQQYEYQQKLAERKENVLKLIEEQGKLTEEIKQSVIECTKLSQVEDIYRPYAQKKKTRATTAIKNGLQPLADWMLALPTEGSLEAEAEKYLSETVTSVADAIQGEMCIRDRIGIVTNVMYA